MMLIIAGFFEVAFTFCLGKAKTTTHTEYKLWIAGFLISLALSMVLLYKATLSIPLGTAYVVWTGIGAVGTVLVGIFLFNEPTDFWRIFFITTLVASVIGLKVLSH